MSETLGAKFAQLLFGCGFAFTQHNDSGDIFAELIVRHGEGDDLRDGGMIHQHFIHFDRRDFFTTPVDDFFEPSGERQKTIRSPSCLDRR